MYPNITTKADALLDNATSGLHTEPNHFGKSGDFQGRTSSGTGGSNPDNNLSVADFCKNSTHDCSPLESGDQVQSAEQRLLQQFVRTKSGKRLYRKAVANNLVALERLLREAGVNINHQSSKSGNTPIMAAARSGHWAMVSLLLGEEASVNIQNKSNYHL
ncbi:ankyrin repeat domain-containing protein [Endozoicomonas sp. ONNA2]|uniref:ankyrin repeat domain-containing protein n=1 Tax=Endozoicomonas sp. ONNA2 TaxID=2828741 RepID=UPI002147846F|nr:ankyrin repeat domain-containing protein [Endozoicomonas sp. ONNA2]